MSTNIQRRGVRMSRQTQSNANIFGQDHNSHHKIDETKDRS